MDLAQSLVEPPIPQPFPAQSRLSTSLCAPAEPPDGPLPVRARTVPPSPRGSGTRHGPVSDGVPASWPRWNSQVGASVPPAPGPCRCRRFFSTADRSRSLPAAARPSQRGPGSPASWPGPAAAAQPSAQPEAAPRRLGRAARKVPPLPRPPPPPPSRLRAPCSFPRSGISPPGVPDPAPGRGGPGRGGKPGKPRGGGAARGTRLERASLAPGAESPLAVLLPTLHLRFPRSDARSTGFLNPFWSS